MAKETKSQIKVGVGIEALWKAITKDFVSVMPKISQNIVDKVEVIEGNGGLGSVYLFHLGIIAKLAKQQREKIVELDESKYKYALQVVEGPTLMRGFSALTTYFQLSAVGEKETLVYVKVVHVPLIEESNMEDMAIQPALNFIHRLEKYLLQVAA